MGFFNLGIAPVKERKVKTSGGCDACGLAKVPDCGAVGGFSDKVLFIGDYPLAEPHNGLFGARELEDPAKPMQSYRYSLLWQLQGTQGLPDKFYDRFAFTWAVPCRCSRKDQTVSRSLCCENRLCALVKKLQPKVIVPMGIVATQALLFGRLKGRITNVQASEFFGKAIPDRYLNAWVCPTYDCASVAAKLDQLEPDSCPRRQLVQHLTKALSLVNVPFPAIPTDVRTTTDAATAASWILQIVKQATQFDPNPKLAIDYETTGLKPHRKEQHIKASSLAWKDAAGYHAIGFKWDPSSKPLTDAWHTLFCKGTNVRLIAHKADFETCWTHFKSGLNGTITDWPENWDWDTCIGAHVLDNNQKVGLKFHTYCELGILGYDEAADPYLSQFLPGENPKSCYALNRLADASRVPWDQIANYCAQDSLYTLMLRDIQQKQMVGQEYQFFQFFLKGMVVLAKVQSAGLPIDLEKVTAVRAELDASKDAAVAKIMQSPEANQFMCKMGRILNPASNKDLIDLLYGVLKLKPVGEKPDATSDTLEKLQLPLAQDILQMRHYAKMAVTFLDGYAREAMWDDPTQLYLIRPFFNLSSGSEGESGGPRTYRSSADSPNFQNIPKRDKEMKHVLRSLFTAPKGWRFMEADYKSLEVMVSASYHHDPNMIKYLQDKKSDMHRDTAADMYLRKPEEISKLERQSIKTGYVFSSFYGASYKTCAQRMWANMPPETKEHLAQLGYNTYAKFTEHVREADAIFWGKRFAAYNQWRRQEWDRYQRDGFVQGYMGCRCYGPMSFTECANRCIQGSGFHSLLQALIWDVQDFERLQLQSRIIGQIHDALVLLVKDEEQSLVEDILYKNGVVRLMHEFKWISVPLVIEAEVSQSGGSWADMGDEHALKFSPDAAADGTLAPGGLDWIDIDKHIREEVQGRQSLPPTRV